jgi:hypothetical protein
VAGINANDHTIRIDARKESRHLRIHWPHEVSARIRGGEFGPFRVAATGEWLILEAGTAVISNQTGDKIVLQEAVPNLNLTLRITNTTDAAQDIDSDLYVVSENAGAVLGVCRRPDDNPASSAYGRLAPAESTSLNLICVLGLSPRDARNIEPLHLMHTRYGWLIPLQALP